MERAWIDRRDDCEWMIEAAYVMPVQEPGQPVAIMGPDIPLHIWFRRDGQELHLIDNLSEPLESLPDETIAALLDAAQATLGTRTARS